MKRSQYLTLVPIAAIMFTLCSVEVMRGEDPRSANKEALTRDLTNLALRAQDYYHRAESKGGGGGRFTGLTANAAGLAKLVYKPINNNGTFSIKSAGTGYSVVLHTSGTQIGTDGNPVSIDIQVFADSTSIWFNN